MKQMKCSTWASWKISPSLAVFRNTPNLALFSNDEAIKRIGVQFMKEPEHVKIAAKELTTDLVDQYYIRVKEGEKFDTMTRLMDVEQPELAIVFGRTKRRVDELTRGLKIRGFRQ